MTFSFLNLPLYRPGNIAAWLLAAFCLSRPGYDVYAGNTEEEGARIFLTFCSGCHGMDGFATYEHAPSFSMGDRLHKSDEELLRSVLDGKHAMPYWQNKLSIGEFRSAIAYLRVIAQRFSSGLPPREEPLPDIHYKFNPVGEDEDYWQNR